MSVDIRLPDLKEGTERQELRQIRSYLYQLALQLQYALGSVNQAQEQTRDKVRALEKQNPAANFTVLKSLIIKSADIVQAYSEEIQRRLEGVYVAQSAFGTHAKETAQQITENSEGIRRSFTSTEQIMGTVSELQSSLLETAAYIKTGLLYEDADGIPCYGVEIGQKTLTDGTVQFQKYTRLSAGKLSFFDENDTQVAYISDQSLHIAQAEVENLNARQASFASLSLGSYSLCPGQDGHLTLS